MCFNKLIDVKGKLYKFRHSWEPFQGTLTETVTKDTLNKFKKIMAMPTLFYGRETWLLTSRQCQRIETTVMHFPRRVLRVSLRDRIRGDVS